MTTYTAFLRGINVGGHNRMKMDELREVCEAMGLQDVRTYIQSGNVVFESPETDTDVLRDDLVAAIHDEFGYDITAMVLTRDDLAAVVDGQPFAEPAADTTKRYAAFLAAEPDDDAIDRLLAVANSAETFVVDGRVVYSKLDKDTLAPGEYTDVGDVLGFPATRRIWNVVEKVLALAMS